MLQSAASRDLLVVIPEFFAKETEAPLTECALKMEVSIPALSRTVLTNGQLMKLCFIHDRKDFDFLLAVALVG